MRHEIRKEFEANRQLQERVSGSRNIENTESLQEIETRLRSEIEIQVRQEFLSQITDGAGDMLNQSMQQTLMPPAPTSPRTSNFIDHAHQSTGLPVIDTSTFTVQQNISAAPLPGAPTSLPAMSPQASAFSARSTPSAPVQPVIPPQPAASKPLSSAAAFSGDFSEEATEIFRLEAEEHLQTIIMHVAALEKAPTNRELIQGIRRATHTLKGAAAMMGFRAACYHQSHPRYCRIP